MRVEEELFTAPWIDAWARQINSSAEYGAAAGDWEGSICFALHGGRGGGERRAYLELRHGRCAQARPASEEDLRQARFVLGARADVWVRLLEGQLDPLMAIMSRRIKLERGRMSDLVPQAQAAKQLVLAARRIGPGMASPPAAPAPTPPVAVAVKADDHRFQTTSPRGLDGDQFPMRLWQKAKRLGTWDPATVDFTRDRQDWNALEPIEQNVLLRLTSLFQAGEEAVAVDLLPLIGAIAAEGRLEEEIYLTSFLFDEAKHVESFRRFLDEVVATREDLSGFHTTSYQRVFYQELPRALHRLREDPSPRAQAEASVTYNMIVEGVLAETGYHAYYWILDRHAILPGMRRIVAHLQADEARHLAYGVYLLSRLVAEHGDPVWQAIEVRMSELLSPAIQTIHEIFDAYEVMPFGLELNVFTDLAQRQFQHRLERIEKARHQSLDEVLRMKTDSTPD